MRYINSIEWGPTGLGWGYIIRGEIGRRFYIDYPKREAVYKYNQECKRRRKASKAM